MAFDIPFQATEQSCFPDGRVQVLGRDSVTINSGGEKIFAEEVETAVKSHPAVYDAVVCGRPSSRWGSEVVAIVQLLEGYEGLESEIIEHCGQHIARYKRPKAVVAVSQIKQVQQANRIIVGRIR